MEDRIAYLKAALQLRSNKNVPAMIHKHSGISKGLLLSIIETEIYSAFNIGYVNAWATLSSHERVDIKGALGSFPRIFNNARKAIPYMQDLETGDQQSLEAAAKRWEQLNKEGQLK